MKRLLVALLALGLLVGGTIAFSIDQIASRAAERGAKGLFQRAKRAAE